MKKLLTVFAIFTMAAVSCGSPDDAAPMALVENAGDAADLADDRPMAASSPLGVFFADAGGTENATLQFTRNVEEAIAQCMREQGHLYTPATPAKTESRAMQNELTEFEWRQEFGYGITTSAEGMLRRSSDMENASEVADMSPAEVESWTIALTGASGENLAKQRPLEEQGCVGQGLLDIGGAKAFQTTLTLGDAYVAGLESILDAKSMIEPLAQWTRCVTAQGYDASGGTQGLRASIGMQLQQIITAIVDARSDATSTDIVEIFDGTRSELPGVADETIKALHTLQQHEVTVAVVDHECYLVHVHDTFAPLRDDYENAFVDQYRNSLTELRDFSARS